MSDINTSYEKYHTHITSKNKRFSLNLGEVWKYKDLIWLFTKKNFKLIYKQTVLGPAWIVLNPVISSLIYMVVFGMIAGLSTAGVPGILFYLSSTAVWTLFSTSLTNNASTFTQNANVFGKVYFPRLTMPISTVISSVIQFGVQMILVLILLAYFTITGEVHPNWIAWVVLPFVLIQLGALGLGFGIIISSMTTKYRDLALLVTFGVQLWMYATPVVYPLSQLGEGTLKTIIMINPVTMPVEVFRYAVLGVGTIDPLFIGISIAVTIVVLLFGISIFNRVEKTFMDTV